MTRTVIFSGQFQKQCVYVTLQAHGPPSRINFVHNMRCPVLSLTFVKLYTSFFKAQCAWISGSQNIRSKVELSVWDHPEDINLSFTATCQDGRPLPGLRKCTDLRIGETVSACLKCSIHRTRHPFLCCLVSFLLLSSLNMYFWWGF